MRRIKRGSVLRAGNAATGLSRPCLLWSGHKSAFVGASAGAGARTAGANAAPRLGGGTPILARFHRGNPQRLLFACGERVSSLLSERPFFVKQIRPAALLALLVPLLLTDCSGGSGSVMPGTASASVGRRPANTLSAAAAKRSTAHVAVTEASVFPGLRAASVVAPPDPRTPVSQLGVVTLPNLALAMLASRESAHPVQLKRY